MELMKTKPRQDLLAAAPSTIHGENVVSMYMSASGNVRIKLKNVPKLEALVEKFHADYRALIESEG